MRRNTNLEPDSCVGCQAAGLQVDRGAREVVCQLCKCTWRRAGRPPAEGEAKTARIEIRTTPKRKAKAARLAKAAKLSVAGWWERKIDEA